MNNVKICAICLVKNEDDIIEQSLTFASRFCDRIFVLDNGSSDDTWNIVQDLARRRSTIVPFEQTLQPYGDWLRALVFNAVRGELSEHDWWFILDSDEFMAEDPRPIIDQAVRERADIINTWQIQFYFTDKDLDDWEHGKDRADRPIVDRRRYYRIDWQEPRFFRNQPNREWDTRECIKVPYGSNGICRRRMLNRHYQYRDPDQMAKRLRLRFGHRLFPHVQSLDWRPEIRDSRKLTLHADGDLWRFSGSGLLHFYRRHLYQRMRSAYNGGAARRLRELVALK
jgi:glycosyltransferase involved in cell wall biosynthesis